MKIDTSSRPACFIGKQSERANLEKWVELFCEYDLTAEIIVEEINIFKDGDLLIYVTSQDTLKDIQENAIFIKKQNKLK